MRIISLLEDQAQMIYFKYLVHDFHKKEIKPWEHIKKLLDRQNYLCLGLFDEENTLFAYAFFCTSQDSSWLFLDYYAVCTEYRGQGYGSIFIELLKKYLTNKNGILAEVENPAYAENEKEKQVCIRRIKFYKKNNWYLSQVYTCVFDVNYQIIQLPFYNSIDDSLIYEEIYNIYHTLFPSSIYDKEIKLHKL